DVNSVPDAAPAACATSEECANRLGSPAICSKFTQQCFKLESDDCKVASGTPDWSNDDAVLIAGFELQSDSGDERMDAEELAFREINRNGPGLPPTIRAGKRRPIVFLRCYYAPDNVQRPAQHVLDIKDFQAVIGPGSSDSV